MQEKINELLEHSFEAYRRGEFSELFGKRYQKYLHSHAVKELIAEVLDNSEYRIALESAFADHPPRSDEIYIYIMEDSGVVTNQRLFLLDQNGLIRPPIEHYEIASYDVSGFWNVRQRIELVDGEVIDRKVPAAADRDTIMTLIKKAKAKADAEAKALVRAKEARGSRPEYPVQMRTDSDRRTGTRAGQLINELVQINGTIAWYYSDRNCTTFGTVHSLKPEEEYVDAGFGSNKVYKRVIEIGQELNAQGGKTSMRKAYEAMAADGRGWEEALSKAWHGIGSWLH